MKKAFYIFILFCLLLLQSHFAFTQVTVLSQNFDGGGLPAGWTRAVATNCGSTAYNSWMNTSEIASTASNWCGSGCTTGRGGAGRCMFFYDWFFSGVNGNYLQSPSNDLTTYSAATLTFYYYNSSETDVINVYAKQGAGGYSLIGGAYTTGGAAWVPVTINMNAWTGAGFNQVYFKFVGTGVCGLTNIAIDDVLLTATLACVTPTTQASALNFTSVGCGSMTVNWTNGNGTKRVVKMNTSNSFTSPADGTDPAANTVWGGSEQVVYNNSGSSVTVTNLSASTTYWFRVWEYNCTGASTKYYTVTNGTNPLSQATSVPTPATPGAISGTATQCPSVTGQTYSIAAVTNATTYTWVVPAGWTITGGQGTISITVTTGIIGQNGNITVTAGNACGTSAAASLAVTVAAASTPNAGPDQYVCSTQGTAVMAGTGTGTWTQISGPATTGLPSSVANVTISLTGGSGTYEFRWTACGGAYDDMVVVKQ